MYSAALTGDGLSGAAVLNFLGTKNFAALEDGVGYVTTFNMPNVRLTRQTPQTRGPGDIPLSVDYQAYRTSGVEPLTVTNTSDLT